uniref:Abasic site processing protein HMCES n=1 Tax=Echeneis naucrates TaxID=173247 RepID=A0A665UW31_ECHNA
MCGRTACTLAADELRRACSYRDRAGRRRRPRWRDGHADKYQPSYNKSPQSMGPVLLSQRHFDQDAPVDKCVLANMRWGLVPAWFKESDPSKMHYSTSNCRSENILEKKSYKYALTKGQRCVVVADGFYEWKRQEKNKQPFFIYFPQTKENSGTKGETSGEWTGWRLLTIAGVFDCWTPPGGGEPLYTYTVITINASPNLENIHDRMPAILDGEEEVRKWLDFGEVKCLDPVDLGSKKPTASSKMMTSWLTSSPLKRRESDTCKTKGEGESNYVNKRKSTGTLQHWLQVASKKPRTK